MFFSWDDRSWRRHEEYAKRFHQLRVVTQTDRYSRFSLHPWLSAAQGWYQKVTFIGIVSGPTRILVHSVTVVVCRRCPRVVGMQRGLDLMQLNVTVM